MTKKVNVILWLIHLLGNYNLMFSGWLSLLLFGDRVLRRNIQLSSCDSKIKVISSDTFFSIFSIMVNFASLEKLWFAKRRCCSTGSSSS